MSIPQPSHANVLWFLPTHGDGRHLGTTIGGRPVSLHYLRQIAQAADELGADYHVGTTLSVDSDFAGVGRPGVGGYLQPWNIEMLATYNRAGSLDLHFDYAAPAVLATVGAVLVAVGLSRD